ncbi:MAG: DsbA family protein [Acidimicrobiia bacterium]
MNSPIESALVYVGDPMCSWCWGFAPVIDAVAAARHLDIEIVVGGLRPGPAAQPLTQRMEEFLRREWEMIHQRTRQPFDAGILKELGRSWSYDTEIPARAVVAMRDQLPGETWRFFGRLQKAFYAQRVDVTDTTAYKVLLDGFDVEPSRFIDRLGSDELGQETLGDFARARRWGITGFPTLLFRRGEQLHLLTAGYRPADDVAAALGSILE